MAGVACPKCGKIRKIDIISTPDGWNQPPCYNCGDPGYIEPYDDSPTPREEFEKQFGSITDEQWEWLKQFCLRNPVTGGSTEEHDRIADLEWQIRNLGSVPITFHRKE
jgi:hypothetical protein